MLLGRVNRTGINDLKLNSTGQEGPKVDELDSTMSSLERLLISRTRDDFITLACTFSSLDTSRALLLAEEVMLVAHELTGARKMTVLFKATFASVVESFKWLLTVLSFS